MGQIVAVDKGFYQEARAKGVTPLTYLTQQANVEPPEIHKTYERVLRRFGQGDDGSNRANALYQFAYDLTGLEKELEVRGIVTRGPCSDKVEKFFSSANDTALFPVFLASQIIAGMLASSLVPSLIASEQRVNSHVAEKITSSDTAATRTLRWSGEGVDLPKTKILRAEGSIKLYKYGRLLEASYESIRLMNVDIFGLMLQRMGMQIGIDQTDDLLETLIAGDGTTDSAITDTDAEVSGTLDYDELIRLRLAFPIGYDMQHVVINDTNLRTVLNMAEFKDPLAGFQFQRTGEFMDALGAMFHRWTSTGSTSYSTDRILGVDARGAAVLFREGDLLEESDQLIDKQLHQRTMSEWIGFMKWDNNASQCLDITA
jgi:Phage capsid family